MLALSMPCYQGAVSGPSSSDVSIKKMVDFRSVEGAAEESPGVLLVSHGVNTARL